MPDKTRSKLLPRNVANRFPLHEKSFQRVVSNVEDHAIFPLTPEGLVASWNTGAERILGYRANEILGKNSLIFYSLEDVERGLPKQTIDLVKARGTYVEEGWRIRND